MPLTISGIKHDRNWMVVSQAGQFITQRTHPQMALIDTAIENDQLVLSSFGLDDHVVPPVDAGMPRLKSAVWGDQVNAVELDAETCRWLSQALDSDCKLVAFPDNEIRQCDLDYTRPGDGDHTRFADAFPLLLISQGSLDHLNSKLAQPVGMERFRPNIVVDGCAAHAEDAWQHLGANGITIRIVKSCPRCSVPTVDPQAGVLAGPEPIHTLSSYRQRDGEIYFGMNAVPENEGIIRVGDEVTVA